MIRKLPHLCCVDQSGTSIQILLEPCGMFFFIKLGLYKPWIIMVRVQFLKLHFRTKRKLTFVENTRENISVMFHWSLQSGNTTFLTYAWTCVTPWEKTRQVQAMGGQQIEHHWIRKSAATYIFFPCTRNMKLIPHQLYLIFCSIAINIFWILDHWQMYWFF